MYASCKLGSKTEILDRMPMPPGVDPRNNEIWDRATNAFGTAAIFERRARKYRRLVRSLTFFGLVIPLAIGSIVAANLLEKLPLERVIYCAGVLGVVQAVIFLWSVVANWPESLDYSSAANADNLRLSNQLKALAVQSVSPPADFDVRYTELRAMDEAQIAQDTRKDISDAEKVYGTRAGLLQFERKCNVNVCGIVPTSMKMPFWRWNRCPRCGGPKRNEPSKESTHSRDI